MRLLCVLLFSPGALSLRIEGEIETDSRRPAAALSFRHKVRARAGSQQPAEAVSEGDNLCSSTWDYQLRRSSYGNGTWVPIDNAEWARSQLAKYDKGTFHCGPQARVVQSMGWGWQPDSCKMMAFDVSDFNEKLQGRKIHFIGDSLNGNMADSAKHLGVDTSSVTQIRFDHLGQKEDGGRILGSAEGVARQWKEVLAKINYKPDDIIVFNAGAHWFQPVNVTRENMKVIAREAAKLVSGPIIFRTTVMGHDKCQKYSHPLEEYSPEHKKEFASKYNWKDFGDINMAVIEEFNHVMPQRFYVLDITMFEMRPDGHFIGEKEADCLHYCVPGPVDNWNYFLYHLLVEQKILK